MQSAGASKKASLASISHHDEGLPTFPLLTHSHVVDRRLRESQSTTAVDASEAEEAEKSYDRRPVLRSLAQQQLSSLYQGYGTHYIDIWVGYPPQRQTAVVDTGSSVTAFPCSSCANCGSHADPPFDERSSQSFHITPCSGGDGRPCIFGNCDLDKREGGECWIERTYGSGPEVSGWKAYEADDVAYAGGCTIVLSHTTRDRGRTGRIPVRRANFRSR